MHRSPERATQDLLGVVPPFQGLEVRLASNPGRALRSALGFDVLALSGQISSEYLNGDRIQIPKSLQDLQSIVRISMPNRDRALLHL
jgi:hypothetical protein